MADEPPVNLYGDRLIAVSPGCGAAKSSQRTDRLDLAALGRIRARVKRGQTVLAADLACGLGGQAGRMARVDARVIALDRVDFTESIARQRQAAGREEAALRFVQGDLRELGTVLAEFLGRFHVLVCQRALHYLPYDEAVVVVRSMASLVAPDGRLYLSASGLDSALGRDYEAGRRDVKHRFGRLAPERIHRHQIAEPVCLYRWEEFSALLGRAGLRVGRLWSSRFGNVKAIAARR